MVAVSTPVQRRIEAQTCNNKTQSTRIQPGDFLCRERPGHAMYHGSCPWASANGGEPLHRVMHCRHTCNRSKSKGGNVATSHKQATGAATRVAKGSQTKKATPKPKKLSGGEAGKNGRHRKEGARYHGGVVILTHTLGHHLRTSGAMSLNRHPPMASKPKHPLW